MPVVNSWRPVSKSLIGCDECLWNYIGDPVPGSIPGGETHGAVVAQIRISFTPNCRHMIF